MLQAIGKKENKNSRNRNEFDSSIGLKLLMELILVLSELLYNIQKLLVMGNYQAWQKFYNILSLSIFQMKEYTDPIGFEPHSSQHTKGSNRRAGQLQISNLV